eukprot:TRINITY_DN4538_c0_g1_i8.p1 TRINITY_DN4538_c0_g1~~TRINITY_DN4538_c0_g1_i8.p1  ORF type:complete len:584 (-),score=61.22 TRINITY_DN4538_c0_g1_i8:188-1939(-)
MEPPAEQVTQGEYELGTMRSPVLTGWKLRAFTTAIQWLNLDLLRATLARASNVQVLQLNYPETPTFLPIHPHPSLNDEEAMIQLPQKYLLDRLKVVLEALPEIGETNLLMLPSIRDYHQAYQTKKSDPTKVVDFILKKLEVIDKQRQPLQWMQSYHKQNVLNQAEESKARWENGKPISVFDGVPYVVKDSIDAIPYRSTCGTTFLGESRKVEEDDPAVDALRSLGAILIGKATLHELGLGTTGVNTKMGTAKNPHDPDFMTGGSSSGCAAMVASGLVPFSIGTDGGGSIRIPASFCGIFGLKPQFGRFSSRGIKNEYSNGVKGPLCSNPEDLALVLAACSNLDENPDKVAPLRIPKSMTSTKMWTIGFYRDWFNDADEAVIAKCKHVLDLLSNIGMTVKTITIPELERQRVAHSCTIVSEIRSAFNYAYVDPKLQNELNLDTLVTLWAAEQFTAQNYLQAQKIRTRTIIHFERIFAEVDFIVTPTVPTPAQRLDPDVLECGESNLSRVTQINKFSFSANFAGYPAVSIPVGSSYEGLPIGIQFMSKAWMEHELVHLAIILEKEMRKDGLIMERPKMYFNPLEV